MGEGSRHVEWLAVAVVAAAAWSLPQQQLLFFEQTFRPRERRRAVSVSKVVVMLEDATKAGLGLTSNSGTINTYHVTKFTHKIAGKILYAKLFNIKPLRPEQLFKSQFEIICQTKY